MRSSCRVVALSPGLYVLLGNGNGTFGVSTVYPSTLGGGNWTRTVAVVDVNRDGLLDLVSSASSIQLGNGSGTFGPPVGPFFGNTFHLSVGDVDGNGSPDILVPAVFTNTISVIRNACSAPQFENTVPCGRRLNASVGVPVTFEVMAAAFAGAAARMTVAGTASRPGPSSSHRASARSRIASAMSSSMRRLVPPDLMHRLQPGTVVYEGLGGSSARACAFARQVLIWRPRSRNPARGGGATE